MNAEGIDRLNASMSSAKRGRSGISQNPSSNNQPVHHNSISTESDHKTELEASDTASTSKNRANSQYTAVSFGRSTAVEAYSAKTVFFYKDGDEYFTSRFRNLNCLMDALNESIPLPYGVRRLHTPSGKTKIESINDFTHNGSYIASSSVKPRGVNVDEVERKRKFQESNERRWRWQQASNNTSLRSNFSITVEKPIGIDNKKERRLLPAPNGRRLSASKMRVTLNANKNALTFMPGSTKQMYFILNGHPHRTFRTVINSERRIDFGNLLAEISRGLGSTISSLFNFDGVQIDDMNQLLELKEPRVVAVPIGEQLQINGLMFGKFSSSSSEQLPRIATNSGTETLSSKTSSSTRSKSRIDHRNSYTNSIEHSTSYANAVPRPKISNLERQRDAARKQKSSIPRKSNSNINSLPRVTNKKSIELIPNGRIKNREKKMMDDKLVKIVPKVRAARLIPPRPQSSSSSSSQRSRLEQMRSAGENKASFTRKARSVENNKKPTPEERTYIEDEGFPEEPPELKSLRESRSINDDNVTESKLNENRFSAGVESSKYENEPSVIGSKEFEPERLENKTPSLTFDENDENVDQDIEQVSETLERNKNLNRSEEKMSDDELIASEQKSFDTKISHEKLEESGNLSEGLSHKSELLNGTNEERDIEGLIHRQHNAAVTLQKHWKGYSTRQQLKKAEFEENESTDEEYALPVKVYPTGNELDSGKESLKSANGSEGSAYVVMVVTGDFHGADSDADLYIIFHDNDGAKTEKIYMVQNFNTVGPKFTHTEATRFAIKIPIKLGLLTKLTVGHDKVGYGAGIFIDRILVMEEPETNNVGGREYLFLCHKWFDTDLVDGQIERELKLTAFNAFSTIPIVRNTRRWELVVHGGTQKGKGSTTSNLSITAYGTTGISQISGLYDSRLAHWPAEGLFQLDFGNIGELYKIRIEIDGNGSKPNFFLDFVEFKDLDTEEQFTVMCKKWLRIKGKKYGAQSFRELPAFHIGVEAFKVFTYEGEIAIPKGSIALCDDGDFKMELFGTAGETGMFKVSLNDMNSEDYEMKENYDRKNKNIVTIPFKVESVCIRNMLGARFYLNPNSLGKETYEGILMVQQLFDQFCTQNDRIISNNSNWMMCRIAVRESKHTPFAYISDRSLLKNITSDDEFIKELYLTKIESTSIKRARSNSQDRRTSSNWNAIVTVDLEESSLMPEVVLCGVGQAKMEPVDLYPSGSGILNYQLLTSEIGILRKLRLCADKNTSLKTDSVENRDTNSVGQTIIRYIVIHDTITGAEVRFPGVELEENLVIELPADWPDEMPLDYVVYNIRISTKQSSNSTDRATFSAYLNLFGEAGDFGSRLLTYNRRNSDYGLTPSVPFTPNSKCTFDFEAISLGELEFAELTVVSHEIQEDFIWECEELIVTDLNTTLFYVFKFAMPFTSENKQQKCKLLPFTGSL